MPHHLSGFPEEELIDTVMKERGLKQQKEAADLFGVRVMGVPILQTLCSPGMHHGVLYW